MYKRLQSLLVLSFGLMISAFAQERTISGTVSEEPGLIPIPGVTVIIKGTTIGTVTNHDGQYSLKSTSAEDVFIFSFIGYQSKEVIVGSNDILNISLTPYLEQLDEIVVVGYGVTEKTSFTGAVTMVDSDKIKNIQTSNPLSGLEGSVPGLQMTGVTGQPGSSPTINIRGFSSINNSNNPLIIVDGTPFDGELNSINPKDIASYSVLKDASGTAIYGARATNGIIMITTKSGGSNTPKINVSARVGVSERAFKEYKRVNSAQYYEAMFEARKNKLISTGKTEEEARYQAKTDFIGEELGSYNAFDVAASEVVNLDGTINSNANLLYEDDWQNEMFGTALRQEYNISFNGSNEKLDYYLSTGYLNEEGIVDNSGFEKITTRLKVNTDVKPWLKAGANLNYAFTKSNFMRATGTAISNPFYSTRMMGPIYPVYVRDEAGNYVYEQDGTKQYDYGTGDMNGWQRPYAQNSNVVATTKLDANESNYHNIGARGYLSINFLKDFNFKTNISTDINSREGMKHQNKNYGEASGATNGRSTKKYSTTFSYTFNQMLTYQKSINSFHNFNVILGHEAYKYQYDYLYATRSGFSIPNMIELGAATNTEKASSYLLEHAIESYFGRAEYNYKSKYFLSISARTDGTSRFYTPVQWGNFWSIGASWRLTEENFLNNLTWLNELKLRSSYGVLGNEGVLDEYGNQNYYPYSPLYDLGYPNDNMSGGFLTSLANYNLLWEKNTSANVGLDFTLLNRINGTFEYYVKDSKDLIMREPVAPSIGFDAVNANVGAVRNSGFEVTINTDILKFKDFNWNLGILWAKNINKITGLSSESLVLSNKLLKEGGTIYDFYYVEFAGVDSQTGDALYWMNILDEEGNSTGEREKTNDYNAANENSRTVMGTAIPDFQGSFTNTFSYKDFDLSILMTFSKGGLIYDNSYANLMMPSQGKALHIDAYEKAWRTPGQETNVPRLQLDENNISRPSSRFLTDASYFGIRNMALGYTLPSTFTTKMKIASLRSYITADNLWYSNERQGLYINPSANGNTSYDYVPIRTISFGLDLSL